MVPATSASSRRRSDQIEGYDSYDIDWIPTDYLNCYYSAVNEDEKHTIRFFVDALKQIDDLGDVLFFGCGPTLHHVFLAAPKARSIVLADYLSSNMDEIQKWLSNDPDAHNWRKFVRYALECESVAKPTEEDIETREKLTRSKITELLSKTDVGESAPLGRDGTAKYKTVISAYCADAVTTDKEVWRRYMRNIANLVAPGGHFIVSALGNTSAYRINGKVFPCVNIHKEDMESALGLDFTRCAIRVLEVSSLGEQKDLGYTSIILAHTSKPL